MGRCLAGLPLPLYLPAFVQAFTQNRVTAMVADGIRVRRSNIQNNCKEKVNSIDEKPGAAVETAKGGSRNRNFVHFMIEI